VGRRRRGSGAFSVGYLMGTALVVLVFRWVGGRRPCPYASRNSTAQSHPPAAI